MMKTALAMVYITIDNYENAIKLSNLLLNQKLIACCNIISKESSITSIYNW